MQYKLHLTIHSLPKSLNRTLRTHYHKINKTNKAWDLLICGMTRGKLPPQPLTKAKLKITRHFYRTLDFDGLVGSLKPIADALISCGVIKDDSWAVLGAWEVDQVFRPKKEGPILEIEVTEVQQAAEGTQTN